MMDDYSFADTVVITKSAVEPRTEAEYAQIGREFLDAKALTSYPRNPSGIAPVEFKVLIEPKEQAEKIGSIIVPEEAKEKGKWAEIEGRIVAVSPLAFTYSTDEEWGGQKPKPGDRIIIAKYSGVRVKGADGKEYLLTNDKDVCAVRRD